MISERFKTVVAINKYLLNEAAKGKTVYVLPYGIGWAMGDNNALFLVHDKECYLRERECADRSCLNKLVDFLQKESMGDKKALVKYGERKFTGLGTYVEYVHDEGRIHLRKDLAKIAGDVNLYMAYYAKNDRVKAPLICSMQPDIQMLFAPMCLKEGDNL